MPQLASEIQIALNTLSRGSEGIDAVSDMTSENNRFARALQDLQRLADEQQIPLAIVGGLAAIRYGYAAATQDIDIAVGQDHLPRLIATAPRYGLVVAWESKTGWHTLTHGDVEINIVPEGAKARDSSPTQIPGPHAMGVTTSLQYAAIESWIELKISSGRQKDHAHVVEVLKKATSDVIGKIRIHLVQTHASYAQTFDQLIADAIVERQQEQTRR